MSGYFQWIILSGLTGSPLGSAVFLLIFWFTVDRFTLGILPDPFRWVMRRRRESKLAHMLLGNPHDNRARVELAQLLVERGKYTRGVELMKPVLQGGADDVQSVALMGEACVGAGFVAQGEQLLAHARELDPKFRLGELDFVLGRFQLKRKEFAAAKRSLEAFVNERKGTIQGRVMLAQAMQGLGDDANAALMMDAAWNEYLSAARFQRRRERWWAWRARPSRPIALLVVVLLVLFVVATVVGPKVSEWSRTQQLNNGWQGGALNPYQGSNGNADDNEP